MVDRLRDGLSGVAVHEVREQVTDQLDYDQTVEKLDISGTDDYIEDAGKVWIPRSLMTVIEYDDGSDADEEPVADVDSTDASSITGGVLGDN